MDFSQNVNSKMWDLEKFQVSPLRIHGQEDVESQLVPSSIEWMSVCVCVCVRRGGGYTSDIEGSQE